MSAPDMPATKAAPMTSKPQSDAPCVTCSTCQAAQKTEEDKLIRLIQRTIAPGSWSDEGGPATLEYYPLGGSLVVKQTAEVHGKIAKMLAELRREQQTEVAVEVRFITVSDSSVERMGPSFSKDGGALGASLGLDGAPGEGTRVAFLNDRQLRQFMEVAQGDQRSNVLQAPKMTLFNGQAATFQALDKHYFVTSVDVQHKDGQVVYVPRNEEISTGVQLSLRPTVSADRRFVRLEVKADLKDLASHAVPLFPVTTFITPIFEGGAVGQPVPFTQHIQQPTFNTLAVQKTLSIPDGDTALIGNWKKIVESSYEEGPPVLSKLPYVDRLFKNVAYGRETERVLMLVTPRIIFNEEEQHCQTPPEAKSCPTRERTKNAPPPPYYYVHPENQRVTYTEVQPSKDNQANLTTLVTAYRQACAEGRLADATKLAVQALALDPTCFSKGTAQEE
jgi:type II secretory pathway component GspD/PulD (secretin)